MNTNDLEPDWILVSEFAGVRVRVDRAANGPRLEIEDLKSGIKAYFDPLQLEGLVWARWDDLRQLVDPARDRRWSDGKLDAESTDP